MVDYNVRWRALHAGDGHHARRNKIQFDVPAYAPDSASAACSRTATGPSHNRFDACRQAWRTARALRPGRDAGANNADVSDRNRQPAPEENVELQVGGGAAAPGLGRSLTETVYGGLWR